MGLFTFIKDAGAKVFGYDSSEEANTKAETQIAEFVGKYEFPVNNFGVRVAQEKATLSGEAQDWPTREKVILTVGNMNGIAEVEDQMTLAQIAEAQTSIPEPVFYTVKSGDTLSKISKEYYGSANKYQVIFEANTPMLSHPDKIYPGQTLRIPNTENDTSHLA